nr:2-C-methyl-D-erythritol 2,4-cyclodiphosphate synthase [Chloroflexia bacterium]
RQDSVVAGLAATPAAEVVVVHDGARPLASAALFDACVAAARETGAAIAAVPVADTLKLVEAGRIVRTVDRAGVWAAQTPQAFRRALLLELFARAGERSVTDEAALCEALAIPVAVVEGSPANIKVTRPGDLAVAEALLLSRRVGESASWEEEIGGRQGGSTGYRGAGDGTANDNVWSDASSISPSRLPDSPTPRLPRTGIGYDVHRFAAGRRLVLGGVEVPSELGLAGHSDADVLLHAVCDALLGAAGLGDIGAFFPPGDPRFAGADSRELLRESVRLVTAAGWVPVNVDATVVAEAPRIHPHVAAMKTEIAACLGLAADAVGVKATTNEGMGFVGRGEGIAALAVATVAPVEVTGAAVEAKPGGGR